MATETNTKFPSILSATPEDIQLLLAAQCHIGTKNCDKSMEGYVWKRRADGVNILNIGKTWEKIILAARVLATIDNPADVCVISARPYGHRAVLKYAGFTGANAIAGRFTPGNFTNYNTRSFKEPRIIIVTDPRVDHQAIREAAYVNIPVIALCDSDASLKFVDVAIPTNNKSRHSIGLIWYLLCREVLRLRGTLPRSEAWSVLPDLFFYRDPEEIEREAADKAAASAEAAGENQTEAVPPSGDWETAATEGAGFAAEPTAQTLDWSADAPAGDWSADAPAAGAGSW